MSGDAAYEATIVITTKDRSEDLRRALRSAVGQTARCEVLVVDDGSTDGTAEMVREQFPEVHLHRSEVPIGYIAQRNRAATLAQAPVIVSIDDDAELTSPEVVAQALASFDHPRVGAVALPYRNVKSERQVRQAATDPTVTQVTWTYVGTAHAVRRDVFLALEGYREILFHFWEEPDLCLRMLDAGYVTRLASVDPIDHHESPARQSDRKWFYGRRNDVLVAYLNVPAVSLPLHLARLTAIAVVVAARSRRPLVVLRGTLAGHREGLRQLSARRPVRRRVFRLRQRLERHGPRPLEEVLRLLPGPAPAAGSEATAAPVEVAR